MITPGQKYKSRFDPEAETLYIDKSTGCGFWRCVGEESGRGKEVHQELLRSDYELVTGDAGQGEMF